MKAASSIFVVERYEHRHLDGDTGRDGDEEGAPLLLPSANAFSECAIIFSKQEE